MHGYVLLLFTYFITNVIYMFCVCSVICVTKVLLSVGNEDAFQIILMNRYKKINSIYLTIVMQQI